MNKNEKKPSILLCRTMFCQNCYDNKTPQKGQKFLVIGRGRQKYEVATVTENGRFGFTPHIIEKTKIEKGIVTFGATCAMHGCDTVIERNEEDGTYHMEILAITIHEIPINDWNALVLYTRDDDYWLG